MNSLNIFDSSTLNISSIQSQDELIADIMPKLQSILLRAFPNTPQKQKIKKYKDRISFAAPCCGDSAKDNTKKRGNIILDGPHKNMYKCHNCGTYMPLTTFFTKYGESLSLGAIDYISNNKASFEKFTTDSSTNLLFDIETIEKYAVDREYFKEKCHLVECNIYNEGYLYLIGRKQYRFEKFLYSVKGKLLYLLNLTPSGKILGLQVRSLDPNYTGPKYRTFNLGNIYKILLQQDDVEISDELNTLSMQFNILLVNYNLPVTILEGPMDSFLIKNAVAICGANKHINMLFRHRFMFDDDDTGRKNAIKLLETGNEVFLWQKFKKDMDLPYKKKWDMNDVVLYYSQTNKKLPSLDPYFSNDILDLIEI